MSDQRPEPPAHGSEKEVLLGFLAFLRETIVWKLEGLSEAQSRMTIPSSTVTLLGMTRHLQYVERYWFRHIFAGEDVDFPWSDNDPDADWRVAETDTAAEVISAYREECLLCNRVIANAEMDTVAKRERPGLPGLQLRWIMTHMIEETGRHCGHADLLREAIDGSIGE